MDEFSFTLPGAEEHQRRAFRTSIPGLKAYVYEFKRSFPIRDLSAMGMGLDSQGERFEKGMAFTFDLMLNEKRYLPELSATVMRIEEGRLVGCAFGEMDKRKEPRLDKLVLEVQKRMISLRKAREDKKNEG